MFNGLNRVAFLSLFVALSSLSIFAQSDLGDYVLKTKDGYIVVQNRKATSFYFEFKGEKFEPMDSDHPKFMIDGKRIQIVTIARDEFWKTFADSKKEPTDEELLELHKKWESDYLGNSLGEKLDVKSQIVESPTKRKMMYWSFAVPKAAALEVSNYIFLTTVVGKIILALNSGIESADSEAAYRTYLTETMSTLKTSETPFDVKKIVDGLK